MSGHTNIPFGRCKYSSRAIAVVLSKQKRKHPAQQKLQNIISLQIFAWQINGAIQLCTKLVKREMERYALLNQSSPFSNKGPLVGGECSTSLFHPPEQVALDLQQEV